MTDLKDCLLQFPDIKPVDHAKNCPKYTNILNRNPDDEISMDELDDLQIELESLLASATLRMRQLKSEMKILSDIQDNKKEKKVSRGKDADHKRSRIVDDRPVKKMKIIEPGHHSPHVIKPPTALNSSTSSPSGSSRPKSKSGTVSKPVESDVVEEQPVAQRSADVPNRFWQMVDTYCAPIPQETIHWLEKLDKPLSDDLFEIPPLGRHFSQVWMEEDLKSEEREGGRSGESSSTSDKSSVDKIMKKAKDSVDNIETCPFGSLTQRLISAFVQENIMAPMDTGNEAARSLEGNLSNEQTISSKSGKSWSSPHTNKLEARIKAELIEQGILDAPSESDKDEDEVLQELKRCQQELRIVSDRNRKVVAQLLKLAKDDMKKQELRKKIENANNEVLDHYRRIFGARQKKRHLTRKEKESATKSLKEREILVKQLDQLT